MVAVRRGWTITGTESVSVQGMCPVGARRCGHAFGGAHDHRPDHGVLPFVEATAP